MNGNLSLESRIKMQKWSLLLQFLTFSYLISCLLRWRLLTTLEKKERDSEWISLRLVVETERIILLIVVAELSVLLLSFLLNFANVCKMWSDLNFHDGSLVSFNSFADSVDLREHEMLMMEWAWRQVGKLGTLFIFKNMMKSSTWKIK